MDRVIVYYHKESDTMDIWFGEPKDEFSCEEAGEGVILKKNKEGKVIGLEKLYVRKSLGMLTKEQPFPVEVVVA